MMVNRSVRMCISTIAAVRYQRFLLRDKAATVPNGQTGVWMGVGIQQIRGPVALVAARKVAPKSKWGNCRCVNAISGYNLPEKHSKQAWV